MRSGARYCIIAVCMLMVMAIAGGCRSRVATPVLPVEEMHIRRVMMVPFQNLERIYGTNASFTCPLSCNTYFTGPLADGAEVFMTEGLFERMQRRGQIEVLPPEQALGAQASLLRSSKSELSELNLLLESGRDLKADTILLSRLYRFTERQGTPYAADRPASVTFDILLIRTEDGRLLWEGHFNETQHPLTENLLNIDDFFRQKGRWLTARDLAGIGLDKVLQRFPIQ